MFRPDRTALVSDVAEDILGRVTNASTRAQLSTVSRLWHTALGMAIEANTDYSSTLNPGRANEVALRTHLRNRRAMVRIVDLRLGSDDGFMDHITSSHLRRLPQHTPNLTALNLSYCRSLDDAAMTSIAQLPALVQLNLDRCKKITNAAFAEHLPALTQLRDLSLLGCSLLRGTAVKVIAMHLKLLETIVLNSCSDLGNDDIAPLASLPCLRSAHFSGLRQLGSAGILPFGGATGLEDFNVAFCDVNTSCLQHLSQLPHLRKLYLGGNQSLSSLGMRHVARLKGLRYLNLIMTPITDSAIHRLVDLRELEELFVNGCEYLTDDALHDIAGFSALTSLGLGDLVEITDDGIAHLKTLGRLRSLSLQGCIKLGDGALEHLASITTIQNLCLAFCDAVTDTGIRHLTALQDLEDLDLSTCSKLTEATVAEVKAQLPKLRHVSRE